MSDALTEEHFLNFVVPVTITTKKLLSAKVMFDE